MWNRLMGGGGGASENITPQQLAQALGQPDPPVVVDVRSPQEYASGHIPQARLIPLPDLGGRLGELPKDRPVVCVCRSGARSAQATALLARSGYRVQNMSGGMLGWRGPVARG